MELTHLVDTSAFVRMRAPAVASRLRPAVVTGSAALTGIVRMELLFSTAPQLVDKAMRDILVTAYVQTEEADFLRALQVMGLLAARGQHRAAKIPDLLIAAAAERMNLTVWHYDRDFELIAALTGQRQEWVVPAGSVD